MKETLHYYKYKSPIGNLWISLTQEKLCRVDLDYQSLKQFSEKHKHPLKAIHKLPLTLLNELNVYFSGKPIQFKYPITFLQGTAFQRKVWQALTNIPYGQTCNYSDLAKRIKHPKAVRAVGSANGKNPLCIIVPCHRVVAKNGLGGYSGGLHIKKKLLKLENIVL